MQTELHDIMVRILVISPFKHEIKIHLKLPSSSAIDEKRLVVT